MRIYLLPLFLSLASCSIPKMALRSATPVLVNASDGMMKEGNWRFFKDSAPGNIKFMEVLWEQDKSNLGFLSALVKSYAGYSFAIAETLALEEELSGSEDVRWKREAIVYYTRSLDYGLRYLKEKNISNTDLLSSTEAELTKKLEELDHSDIPALLYTAQSWGSLINLQKDNIALVSHVPKVKIMFDHVCRLQPNIDNNVCDIFYAQYESSRPKMLGGNPEKGERLFSEAIKRNPQNLLIRMSYIQFVLIPLMDEERYEKEAAVLRQEFSDWENLNRDGLESVSPYKDAQELNLFNAIAQKRFLIIEKYRKKIF